MEEMLRKIIQNLLIVILTTFILLPTEQDGGFDSIFLPSTTANKVHTKNNHKTKDVVEAVEYLDSETVANFVRNRCDYLDLVYDGFSENHFHFGFISSYFSLRSDRSHTFLLSFLLLNLPPPILT